MEQYKQSLIRKIEKFFPGITTSDLLPAPKGIDADFAIPCYQLAKEMRRPPKCVAKDVAERIAAEGSLLESCRIDSVYSSGNYVNFKIRPEAVVTSILDKVSTEKDAYGSSDMGDNLRIVVDYSGPNIGKPLHIGHIRSTIIGDSIIRLLKYTGHNVYGINYLGDIGLHIGKIVTAYEHWGDEHKLDANPENEMFNLYVRFGKEAEVNPSLEIQAKRVLKEIEACNGSHEALVQKIHSWSNRAFDRVYSMLNINFDEVTGQSKFSDRGKELVRNALEKKIACLAASGEQPLEMESEVNHRGVVVPLRQYGLPDKVVLRDDGTAIYSTQDLGAAVARSQQYKFDKMIYIVANEQSTYFKQIFKILELSGYDWVDKCFHLSFGLINLKDGKISSREGNVVLLEDVLNKAIEEASTKIKNGTENKEVIARQVGIGAIKYMILSVDPVKDIDFSWERAMNFESNSAPYVQYSHARLASILRKKSDEHYSPKDFESNLELNLIKKIGDFPYVVKRSASLLKPNLVANYASELSQLANAFYHSNQILGSDKEASRLCLASATRTTLKNSLTLLGIAAPDRM